MPRDLSIGERVAVQKALKGARALCDLVTGSTDEVLGPQVERILNTRPTTDRLTGIRQEFDKVGKALADTPLDNIDREDADYYAEVDPDVPYRITLGNAFFSAAASGIDSRAGTLVHEATHWKIVRGTDDHAYADLQNLSMTLARNNAQNLERIAEAIEDIDNESEAEAQEAERQREAEQQREVEWQRERQRKADRERREEEQEADREREEARRREEERRRER